MKRWALLVAGLYALMLAALTVPVFLLAFLPQSGESEILHAYAEWAYWAFIGVMLLSQFALLAVPVRVASRRPVTRGALWPTLLAGGMMAAALVAGACYSLLEFFFRDQVFPAWIGWTAFGTVLFTWLVWSVAFYRVSRRGEPGDLISRQCRLLFRGSVLELLIAVPTHIVARYRDYCCAGWMTFIGLTTGIAVMLFSFGPAVFFLFAERWRRLHPAPEAQGV